MIFKVGDKYYKQPIFLRDKEAKINEYGIYDNVYSSGLFVYKPYEYEDQCNITPDVSTALMYEGKRKCYLFMSKFYQDMYPMNKIDIDKERTSRKYLINY